MVFDQVGTPTYAGDLAKFIYHIITESLRQKSTLLSITHEDIAKEIGSVREVVSKTLKYLADEGVVRLGRGKIEILDKGSLGILR